MTSWYSTTQAPSSHVSNDIEDAVHHVIIQAINESEIGQLEKEQARLVVERSVRAVLADRYPEVVGDFKEDIVSHVVDDVTGLGPIESLVRDASISEIMVNAPDIIYFEREGIIYES